MFENKIVIYQEGILGNILSFFTLGLIAGSRVNPVKFTDLLNYHSNDGWEVVAMEKESRRSFLIFKREAFIVILKRKKGASNE
jgi:hypothetical protein